MTSVMSTLSQISNCTECAHALPFAPKPILQYSADAKIVIIGQAPGIRAHSTNKPWNDPSGDRLRNWLNLEKSTFYDKSLVSIVPMGFCYPGKAKSGDLPPRKECAPKWHPLLVKDTPDKLILLIGKYAQDYYLKDKHTLTARLKNWRPYSQQFLLFPHPSPRNNIWLKKNPWFEQDVLPKMQNLLRGKLHRVI